MVARAGRLLKFTFYPDFLAGSFGCFEIEIKVVLLFICKGHGGWRNRYHSREKLINVLVRKPGRKSYCFSQFLAQISSSRISYYFQLLKLAVVEFPTIFVVKFFSGMSLPRKINGNSNFCSPRTWGPWTANSTVPVYISR